MAFRGDPSAQQAHARVDIIRMLDALIIISFIVAGAGVGFYSIDLLSPQVLDQVNNIEGLGTVMAGFGALIGTGV